MKKLSPEFIARVENIAYLTVLAVILLFPALTLNLKRNLSIDNRPAAERPKFSTKEIAAFPQRFELWFGDRFGGRKQYISWGNFLIYNLLRESPHEQVFSGDDGFIFLGSHDGGAANRNSLVKLIFGFDRSAVVAEAARFGSHLEKLKQSPARVLFLNVPTKHLLYFDKMPAAIRKTISKDRFFSAEVEREIAGRYPNERAKYFIDLRSESVGLAPKINLIPPANFHWISGPYTHLAAWLTAKALGMTDEKFVPRRENYESAEVKSDLRHFMYRGLKSRALLTSDADFKKMGIQTFHGSVRLLRGGKPLLPAAEKLIYHSVNPNARGGRMLLLGDSFTNPLCRDMARYFREVVSVEYSALARIDAAGALACMKQIVAAYAPEYITVVCHVNATGFVEDVSRLTEVLKRRK